MLLSRLLKQAYKSSHTSQGEDQGMMAQLQLKGMADLQMTKLVSSCIVIALWDVRQ